jgi:transcriptional regulator with XRE-family HTH domain
VKKSSYGQRDYAFGQAMLTLRTSIGLTQGQLAEHLGVSRNAVGDWEAGESYPSASHLKHLIVLGVRASAFAAGHEAEEVRALWQAAHQKVRLDERWLSTLLSQQLRQGGSWCSIRSSRPVVLSLCWLLRSVGHGWIGAKRSPSRPSMGARGNWLPSASGCSRRAVGW